jgi:hypothetical protein
MGEGDLAHRSVVRVAGIAGLGDGLVVLARERERRMVVGEQRHWVRPERHAPRERAAVVAPVAGHGRRAVDPRRRWSGSRGHRGHGPALCAGPGGRGEDGAGFGGGVAILQAPGKASSGHGAERAGARVTVKRTGKEESEGTYDLPMAGSWLHRGRWAVGGQRQRARGGQRGGAEEVKGRLQTGRVAEGWMDVAMSSMVGRANNEAQRGTSPTR